MTDYTVYFRTIASASVQVTADSEEDAISEAYELLPSLCAQCSGWGRSVGIELGDWSAIDESWPAFPGEKAVEETERD